MLLLCKRDHDHHKEAPLQQIIVRYLRPFPTAFDFATIVVDLDSCSKRMYQILKGNNLIVTSYYNISYNFSQN